MSPSPSKRRPGRPKSIDRERTVAVAMREWWRDGLHAFSLNELCRRADVSKPALYREFGGEDGLMEAALVHYRGLTVTPLLALLAAPLPFAALLERLVTALTTPTAGPAGCLFTRMRLARSRLGPRSLERVDAIEHERRAAFAERYQRALDEGDGHPALSAEQAAAYLDTQVTTVLIQLAAGAEPADVAAQARLALSVLRAPA